MPRKKPTGSPKAETANIAAVANKIANDIFKVFFWEMHRQQDSNFICVADDHKTETGQKKATHPEDVVFHYFDSYLSRRIYLHTDLKSYKKSTIQQGKIRESLKSLAMTVECASLSESWREKFPEIEGEPYEVRGLLFVANHDGKAIDKFRSFLKRRPLTRTCPCCDSLARPSVLMFNDSAWLARRAEERESRLRRWLSQVSRPVIVEMGAGTRILSVRSFSHEAVISHGGRLVRINPREPAVPTPLDVGIACGALQGLSAIDAGSRE